MERFLFKKSPVEKNLFTRATVEEKNIRTYYRRKLKKLFYVILLEIQLNSELDAVLFHVGESSLTEANP